MLKIGLIGAGAIGEVHLKGFERNKFCNVVSVASRTKEHAQQAADKFNIPNIFIGDEWIDLLNEDIDAVSICTPNYLHSEMILRSLERDIHVLCEKPIAILQDELNQIEHIISKKDLVFYTMFNKRYNPIFPRIKKIITKRILGKIINVRYYLSHYGPYKSWRAKSKEKWFFDPEKAGGGVLLDLGVHCIDIFRYLLGDYKAINGISYDTSCIKMKEEDSCNVNFTLQKGTLGLISVSWCNPPSEFIEFYGTDGLLRLNLFKNKFTVTPSKLRKSPLLNRFFQNNDKKISSYHLLIDDFINSILKKSYSDKSPSFLDGKKAVEFVNKAYSLKN